MKAKTTAPGPPTDYEARVKAMTLATQHSKNCSSDTLVKIADKIYLFLLGEKQPPVS